ncbi:hypothetical protein [Jatrophihabitans endophyticus]|uniref:hypothetical protein n=1 Tax=Jatrophihabitans endophyticus TaxID=1206085 RepID=UPI0019FE58B1|nr:hypothetical protein [Jatrophihabitans endophyticus]MBE7188820.1 hypothetical protein [Jatrophihabitans endophyticus]
MRRFLTRAIGSLFLGALLAAGVGATAASADSTGGATTATVSSSRVQPMDWWA